ncbi:MAG: TonB-dependent receptor, partial [Terriglobus roseus]|nr:TonB-dependent receptor [Terriglobus roseus]
CSVTTTTTFGCYVFVNQGVNRYTQSSNPSGYTVKNFLNPAAFRNAPVATANGQSSYAPLGGGPSQYHGPSYVRADFSLFKNFNFTERIFVQLRAEAFNLANTPNFANPTSSSLSNLSTFGQITTLRDGANGNRQIQFAGKFYF